MTGYLESLGLSIDVGKLEDYKKRKLVLVTTVLKCLNESSVSENFVLKGGTSLLLCYGLNRFSEDIDLDAVRKVKLDKILEDACGRTGFPCKISVKKDTDTVLRYMIEYQEETEVMRYPLKLEISYRNSSLLSIGAFSLTKVKNVRTYDLETLASMKLAAFRNRHAIRDFYDICWLVLNNAQILNKGMALQIWEQVQYRDLNVLVEELKEIAMDDHIMRDLDIEEMALKMLEKLPILMTDGDMKSSSFTKE